MYYFIFLGWDVKCVQWHPRSSVICSGSKDNLVKVRKYKIQIILQIDSTYIRNTKLVNQQLWDPRTGGCLSTLYGHKNTVTKVLVLLLFIISVLVDIIPCALSNIAFNLRISICNVILLAINYGHTIFI